MRRISIPDWKVEPAKCKQISAAKSGEPEKPNTAKRVNIHSRKITGLLSGFCAIIW